MIVNIHGFNSDGHNSKYKWLIKHTNEYIYSPTFNYEVENPINIVNTLANKISLYHGKESITVLASSLGGFFGYILHIMYPDINVILLNPSFMPFINLKSLYGVDTHIVKSYVELFSKYFYDYDFEYGYGLGLHIIYSNRDEVIDHEKCTLSVLPTSFNNIYKVNTDHKMNIEGEVEDKIMKLI